MMKELKLFFALSICFLSCFLNVIKAQTPQEDPATVIFSRKLPSNTYFLDPRPLGKTNTYIGVVPEVLMYADSSNVIDWLADCGVGMVRVAHPDVSFRNELNFETSVYAKVGSYDDFQKFCKNMLKDPEKNIRWEDYRFNIAMPWVGNLDVTMDKLQKNNIQGLLSIAYSPNPVYCSESILKRFDGGVIPPDSLINWGSAASAYEYFFASIYRYASRNNMTNYMMLNEPSSELQNVQQIGVIARMARLALDDVKKALKNKQMAAALKLSAPACFANWETFLPYVAPYVDYIDTHLYDPEGSMAERKIQRILTSARLLNKKVVITEYNRVSGSMSINESLFSMNASLQLADLVMSIQSSSKTNDPTIMCSLLYQFHFPATHRNFKSLVYGDMNGVDWSMRDTYSWSRSASGPSFDQLQLRFATPAYSMFKMLARSAPGGKSNDECYEVYQLQEALVGPAHVHDPSLKRNIYRSLERDKFYAFEGAHRGNNLKTLTVKVGNRLHIYILNNEPSSVTRSIYIGAMKNNYKTAVIRETSLAKRDMAIEQKTIESNSISTTLTGESLTEIILTEEDLSKVSELKIEECKVTTSSLSNLKLLETTRLKALGKYEGKWMDLTDLNVVWSTEANSGLQVYQGGLLQRMVNSSKIEIISAQTLSGKSAEPLKIPSAKTNFN
jgi:hypothetical protein